MALNKLRGGYKACWASEYEQGSASTIGNYGERFNISRQEYEDIRTHLQLYNYTDEDVQRVLNIILL